MSDEGRPDPREPFDHVRWGNQRTAPRARIVLGATVGGVALLVAGGALGNVFVVGAGYVALILSIGRARALLRGIDARELPPDGRPYASFAWMIAMAGSGLAILAFAKALL